MAGKRRHFKEKDGRFWARISVPAALRPSFGGKTQLTEPLGGDLRIADRNLAAAVARLQAKLTEAARCLSASMTLTEPHPTLRAITAADQQNAVWRHYEGTLLSDEAKRSAMPTPEEIEAEYERFLQRVEAGDTDVQQNGVAIFNASTDFELKAGARQFDQKIRVRRLSALRSALQAGDFRLVGSVIDQFAKEHHLAITPGSPDWRAIGHQITRAEITALQKTLERDNGDFSDTLSDPLIKRPTVPEKSLASVPLLPLFHDYIKAKQATGYHRDGGKNWEPVIHRLIKFLGHGDARKIMKRNIRDWRDELLASGLSAKTVSDKHLAAISAVLKWAFEEERIPTNESAKVRQEVPKIVHAREKGYTTPEAVKVLKASLQHMPIETDNPSNRESAHLTAAKRWVPILCAFTGARVTEMTQLRKEDIRKEGKRWILRITPDAGSVKTGQFRDVPLHQQLVALGFPNFVERAKFGPLFHASTSPERQLAGARATSGKLSAWLQALKLVPEGVQPSHGWRHRFKTQGIELGLSERAIDAIQGHAGKTASDDYGDVTVAARVRVIDALPDYDLSDRVDSGETSSG